jgi:hypothetical protein
MLSKSLPALAVLALIPWALQAQNTASGYQRICDGGDLVTCTVVGLIYETGAGGTRDLARAIDLYERSCNREVAAACHRLKLAQSGTAASVPADERVRVGYVADAYDGSALGGASIRVRGIADIGERRYLTDGAGRVVLDPLPFGRHLIDVQRGGYQPTEGELPVPWETDFLILMERVSEEKESDVGQIFGQVTEDGTSDGISDVDITVHGANSVRTISNGQGRFQLSALLPGPVEVEFRRLGYEPRTTRVIVQRSRTVEMYATMSAVPIELAPVEVSVVPLYLERSGFYRRARNATGARFTHRDIALMNPMMVGDIVRRVAGVTVVSAQIGSRSEAISNRRRSGTDSGSCRLLPHFNGVPLVDFELELVPPEEIEALEIYQGANVPIEYRYEFQPAGPSCGVILIWTRDPVRPD